MFRRLNGKIPPMSTLESFLELVTRHPGNYLPKEPKSDVSTSGKMNYFIGIWIDGDP